MEGVQQWPFQAVGEALEVGGWVVNASRHPNIHPHTPFTPNPTPPNPQNQVIPRTLAQNCGTNVLRALTQLRAKHASGKEPTWGINGETGALVDMNVRAGRGLWVGLSVCMYMPRYPTIVMLNRSFRWTDTYQSEIGAGRVGALRRQGADHQDGHRGTRFGVTWRVRACNGSRSLDNGNHCL